MAHPWLTPSARAVWRAPTPLLAACLLSLAGCASLERPPASLAASSATPQPTPQVPGDTVSEARWTGHLSLKLAAFGTERAKGVGMAFDLQGRAEQGALDLSTPLGTLVASVRWSPGLARLHTADGTDSYASLDELVARVLSEPLPVQALMSWLRGQPDPKLPLSDPQAPSAPTFEQAGWRVDATALAESGVLLAHREPQPGVRGATLRIRLER